MYSNVGNELPTQLSFKIFNQQIRPIMEYASEIWWQDSPIELLERVQLKFFKNALRVRQSTPDLAVYGETGQFPLHLRQHDLLIKYWLRILSMHNECIIRRIYDELLTLAEQEYDNLPRKLIPF